MKIIENVDQKAHKNADMNFSAYLLCMGFNFLWVEQPTEGRFAGRTAFIFEYAANLKEAKNTYYQWTALIEPKTFCNQRHYLRRRIKELQESIIKE